MSYSYVFGKLETESGKKCFLQTKGSADPCFPIGDELTLISKDDEMIVTDTFIIEGELKRVTDSEGNVLIWYSVAGHTRNIDRSPAANKRAGKAESKADYIAMMADIDIPGEDDALDEAEMQTVAFASSDPTSFDAPDFDGDTSTEAKPHSAKFERVKQYFDSGFWNAAMVHNAVGRWITSDEEQEILSGNEAE